MSRRCMRCAQRLQSSGAYCDDCHPIVVRELTESWAVKNGRADRKANGGAVHGMRWLEAELPACQATVLPSELFAVQCSVLSVRRKLIEEKRDADANGSWANVVRACEET